MFRPDDDYMSCCASVYKEWCPNSNFFESQEAARTWSKARRLDGRVLTLAEATELAAGQWGPLVGGLSGRHIHLRMLARQARQKLDPSWPVVVYCYDFA